MSILQISISQAFYAPVFTFTHPCPALYKHWQKLYLFPTAIVTHSAVSNGHFLEV